MKALIICFSQTGNTRKIAERISAGIAATGTQCDLKPLDEVDATLPADYDLVGLGAPVFYYQAPFHVRDFMAALPPQNGRHWFVFCTHGNVIGNFFPSVGSQLGARGAKVIGYYNSYADITYPFYPRPSYTSGHPDADDLARAERFGTLMVVESTRFRAQPDAPLPAPLPVSSDDWIKESHHITPERLAKMMPKLSLDADTCIQCRLCEEECPVHGIDITSDPPRLQTPCIFCWRCVNICPTLSITADWRQLVAMAPANYARYKQELDKVTARGEFRWLIDPQMIVFDNPLFKQREREIKGLGK
ncbi:MAG: EFR1 family ferrodoxin [Desulfatitalea sp.]